MSRKILITIAVVVSLLLMGIVVAGAVTTANGNEGNIIYAAYNPNSGSLRIVTDGNYKSNEVPIEWNIKGPPGPQGPQGDPGEPGSVEGIEDIVKALIASELSELIAANEELQNRVLFLEQQLGLAPRDAVITHIYPEYLTVKYGTPFNELASLLPTSVKVVLDEETTDNISVDWQLGSDDYGQESTGTYVFNGTLVLDEGIVNPDQLQAVAYVTVPANIWFNVKQEWNTYYSYNESYDVEITDLPENREFSIEIRRGAVYQTPGSGSVLYSYVFESSVSGTIKVSLPADLIIEPGDLITVTDISQDLYASHGGLYISSLGISFISISNIEGRINIPSGWNNDVYYVHVIADGTDGHDGWEGISYPVYTGGQGDWYGEETGPIYPGMVGTLELRHEYGGGIRSCWQIPECEWEGNVTSHLYGMDSEDNLVYLTAVGNMETQLFAYSWPTEWNVYGEATGSAAGSFYIEKDEQVYDTWDIFNGYYGAGIRGPYGTNAMEGFINRDNASIGNFRIWLHGGGVSGWTGTAEVYNLLDIDGTVYFDQWSGYRVYE